MTTSDRDFLKKLLHPRFWPSWMIVGILYLLVRLPLKTQMAIGRVIGRAAPRVFKYRARIARKNIEMCFPDLSPQRHEEITKNCLESIGVMLMETAHVYLRTEKKLLEHAELQGADVLEQALAKNRGVLIIGAHFTSLEVAGAVIGSHFDYDCVYRQHKNKVVEYLCRRARRRTCKNVIPANDVQRLVKAIVKEKHAVWYGVDQDLGHRRSVWAPFFGVDAATLKAPSKLAAKYGIAVVFMSHIRDEESLKWTVKLEPVLDFPTGDCQQDACTLNSLIEKKIRQNPEQYYWVHRRFKSMKNGGQRNYKTAI